MAGPEDSALRRLRYGLTRMTGQVHQEQRRLVLPPLQKKTVDSYGPQIIDITDRYLSGWSVGETVDIWRKMRQLTLRNSAALLFGLQDPLQVAALGQRIERLLDRNFSVGVWSCPVNFPGTPYRRLLKEAEELETVILNCVQESSEREGSDLLTILIRASKDGNAGMTPAALVGQITILLVCLVLSRTLPPEGALRGGSPTSELLPRMPFLEAVIKESMRILPPVPFTIRAAAQSTTLGGIGLRQGDRVICSHYVTHHMPELYAEPEIFRPRRWSALDPDQYQYMPFSAGPRACIGYSFAMQVMKITLSMILTRFRLILVPGARIDRTVKITMSPRYGMPMSIHKQDRRFQAMPVTGNIRQMVDLGQ